MATAPKTHTSFMPPRSLSEVKRRRQPLHNTHADVMSKLTAIDRLAMWITERVGTIGFFFLIAVWSVLWLGWNLLAPESLRFDPPMGFVLWLFISNLIQILLMPLIMVGQNIQSRYTELRAEHDLHINIKAEEEIEVVLHHLEYQNRLLHVLLQKHGVDIEQALKIDPSAPTA